MGREDENETAESTTKLTRDSLIGFNFLISHLLSFLSNILIPFSLSSLFRTHCNMQLKVENLFSASAPVIQSTCFYNVQSFFYEIGQSDVSVGYSTYRPQFLHCCFMILAQTDHVTMFYHNYTIAKRSFGLLWPLRPTLCFTCDWGHIASVAGMQAALLTYSPVYLSHIWRIKSNIHQRPGQSQNFTWQHWTSNFSSIHMGLVSDVCNRHIDKSLWIPDQSNP